MNFNIDVQPKKDIKRYRTCQLQLQVCITLSPSIDPPSMSSSINLPPRLKLAIEFFILNPKPQNRTV